MSEDLDYDKDVLKFKQVWNQKKNPQNQPDPKNLQTIQSNKQNMKATHKKSADKNTKPNSANKKKTVISHRNMQRNPKANSAEVIQVVTRPQKSFTSNYKNQKNTMAYQTMFLNSYSQPCVNHVSQNHDFKRIIEQRDYQLSLLRVTNSRNQDRIRYLEKQIQQKNQTIQDLKNRQRKVIEQNCSLVNKQFNFDYGKVQYQNFKNDSRRLLKMLQTTHQYQDFAKFALDDNGIRFLHQANKNTKTKLDTPGAQCSQFHFCTCNKAFIPQSGFWVPEKVYSFGKEFIKDRKGDLSQAQLELLLYELNKIWRQRQKRIVNSLNALKANSVGKLKRKIQNISRQKEKRNSYLQE